MGAHTILGGVAGLAGCRQVQSGERDGTAGFTRPVRPSRTNAPGTATGPSLTKARQDALRLLSYRARSRAEIRRRLEKTYPSLVVEQALERLADQGYLDDAAFAREWRRSREERRPRSRRALQYELHRLGVEWEIVQEALAGYDDAGNARRAALRLAQRLDSNDYYHVQGQSLAPSAAPRLPGVRHIRRGQPAVAGASGPASPRCRPRSPGTRTRKSSLRPG